MIFGTPRICARAIALLVLALLPITPVLGDILFVANYEGNNIGKFTSDGTGSVFATSGLNLPDTVSFDGAGNLYVTNAGFNNNSIEVFTPGGVGSVFANTGLNSPTGSAFDSAGKLRA